MQSAGGVKRQKDRGLGTTAGRVSLTHTPTGLTLHVVIPEGSYSKNEFRSLKLKAQEKLLLDMASTLKNR
jgi:hypothetical protein